jgi:cytochrome c553
MKGISRTALLMSLAALPARALPAAEQWPAAPVTAGIAPPAFEVPAWAFPINPPPGATAVAAPAADDARLLRVPNSSAAFTRAQVRDLFAPPDWHPEEHPPMPEVVAHGRRPLVFACAFCHLPDGRGRPENAAVAGLPAAYIEQQLKDLASHARRSAWASPGYLPGELMLRAATNASAAEIAEAADYFSRLPLRSRRAKVVETERVPRTHVAGWMYVPTEGAGDEPLGSRIVEVARDLERHELRDSTAEYVAYVPPGSIARGREIATSGANGLTLPCTSCHGDQLRGVGLVPPIAGRSPTYLLRQLVAFRTGARATAAGQPMQLVVARLELNDMIAVAAYVASQSVTSLPPEPGP